MAMIDNRTLLERCGISLSLRELSRFFSKGTGGKTVTLQLMAVSSNPCAVLVSDGYNRAWVKLAMLPRDVVSFESSEDSFAIVILCALRKEDGSTRSPTGVPIYLSAGSISLERAVDDNDEPIEVVSEVNGEEPPMFQPYGDAAGAPEVHISALSSVMASEGVTSRPPTVPPSAPKTATTINSLFSAIPPALSSSFVGRRLLRISDTPTASSEWWTIARMVSFARRPKGTNRPHAVQVADKTGSLYLKFWAEDDYQLHDMKPGGVYAIVGNGAISENNYQGHRLEMLVSVAEENAKRRQQGRNQLTVAPIDTDEHPHVLNVVPDANSVPAPEAESKAAAVQMTCAEAIQAAMSAPEGSASINFDLPRAYITSVSGMIQPRQGTNMSVRRVVELWDCKAPSSLQLAVTVWGEKGAAESLYELAPTAFSSLATAPIPVSVTGLCIDPTKKQDWRFKAPATCKFTRRVDDTDMEMATDGTSSRIKERLPDLISLAAVDQTAHDERYSFLAYVPAMSEERMIGTSQRVEINLFDSTATKKMSLFPNDPLIGTIRTLPNNTVIAPALTSLPASVDGEVAERIRHQLAIDPDDPANNMFLTAPEHTPLVLFNNVRTYISNGDGSSQTRRYISTDKNTKLVVLDRNLNDPLIVEMEAWYHKHHTHFQASLQPSVPRDYAAYAPAVQSKASSSLFSSLESRARPPAFNGMSYADDEIQDADAPISQAQIKRAETILRKRPLVLGDDD